MNASRWDGIEIRNTTQARLIGTNITNARLRSLDCRFTDTPCTIERPPNLDCSCSKEGQCGPVPLNFPTPQTPPPPPSEEPEIDDVETAGSRQVYYVTPTAAAGTPCPGQPCLTLDQYIASSSTYIISHTVFKLLPGKHDITESFIARNIESITIEGDSENDCNSSPHPRVQISGTSSRYLLQFIESCNVSIVGIELMNVGISLADTKNATISQVVINGPRIAVSLSDTVDTNISCSIFKNTGSDGVDMRNTYNTSIFKTIVNNTGGKGFDLLNATHTEIYDTFINSTRSEGIEMDQVNHTVIKNTDLNNIGWDGIEVRGSNRLLIASTHVNNTRWDGIEIGTANETTIVDTIVNNTGWDGMEFSRTLKTAIVNCIVQNTRWDGIEFSTANNTYIHNTTVINPGRDGIDLCRMTSTNIWFQVKVVGTRRCLRECAPRDPCIQVECLP